MKNALPLASMFFPTPSHQLDACFKGDADQFLDRLVVSSQKRQVEESHLQERALVPFFEPSDSASTTFEPLERRARCKTPFQQQPHHGLKRNAGERSAASLSSSPPKKESHAAAKQRRGAKPSRSGSSGSQSDSELSTASSFSRAGSASEQEASPARKHGRQAAEIPPALAAPAPRRSPSPPHRRGGAATPPAKLGPGKFAGPAYCNSPTPDALPIPTTSLLMQQAAESLRSRLTL